MSEPTEGLPPDLARVLRDQSVIVPQDAAVFEQIAKWANAPSNTASASLPDTSLWICPACEAIIEGADAAGEHRCPNAPHTPGQRRDEK